MTQTVAPRPPSTATDPQAAGRRVAVATSRTPCGRATSTRAAGMFAATSFWRDLSRSPGTSPPSRTPRASRTCSARPSSGTDPGGFATERAARRGRRRHHRVVHVRDGRRSRAGPAAARRGGRRAEGVDVPHHAVRAQGPRGAARRPRGRWAPEHGANKERTTWLEQRQQEAESLGIHDPALRAGRRRRPGRHRPRRPAAPARACPASSSTSTGGPATSGAAATSRSACTTRSGTTTCPT